VLIVGVGGLGCPAALLLAQARVGVLTLLDPDPVELSNLHRQLLFSECDLGKPKAAIAARRLNELFPTTEVAGVVASLDTGNVQRFLAEHDIVVDATDRIETKLWLNDECVRLRKPLVHAGAVGWQGQLCTVLPGESPCLRCIFADTPEDEVLRASCREAGIIGPVVGYLGGRQALEVVLYLSGDSARLLAGRLLLFDGQRPSLRVVRTARDPSCSRCAALP